MIDIRTINTLRTLCLIYLDLPSKRLDHNLALFAQQILDACDRLEEECIRKVL